MNGSVSGVYGPRDIRSWPLRDPRAMGDLARQLLESRRRSSKRRCRPPIRSVVGSLERDGIGILPAVAPVELVEHASRDLDRFVERIDELVGTTRVRRSSTGEWRAFPVHEHQVDLRIFRSHDPLAFSPAFARFLLLRELREVVEGYLGRRWRYQAMIATRTEPSAEDGQGFAKWHHDARGRKLNVFLLITAVDAEGPATIVKRGSHRLLYDHTRRRRNFFTDEEMTALQSRFGWSEAVGAAPAGSLVFFDANALHRGRRSPFRRDAFQVNCMTKHWHLWPQEITADVLATLSPGERRLLVDRADLTVV